MLRGVALLAFSLAVATPAQVDYVWDQVDELGVKYQVIKKLKRIPLQLGEAHPNLRARYEPIGSGDYIHGAMGAMPWGLKVYEFRDDGAVTGKPAEPDAKEKEPTAEEVRGAARRKRQARTFEELVSSDVKDDDYSNRTFRVKAQAVAANRARKKLPYKWWQYTDVQKMTNGVDRFDQTMFKCAAVYELDGREIVLVTDMPGKKELKDEHLGWAKDMLLSVTLLKEKELADDDPVKGEDLFRFTGTPERKKAVEDAKANIAGLETWDIFTTESFIVLYSWPKPDKRRDYLQKAKDVAADMDRMRELYKQHYPPPPGLQLPYSVMRICSTEAEFHKYGETRGGVAGWFSPRSKELVLFHDRQIAKAVAFHEGWHQYADTYFGGIELHRWFDEGTGDFFGSFERRGGDWAYAVSRMRRLDVKALVSTKEFVPLHEIVTWNKDKFYGARAGHYYAQGYSMVDFLTRARERKVAGFDESWGTILERYRKAMLEQKNQKKAVEAAFAGVDWDKLTQAWIAWVKTY